MSTQSCNICLQILDQITFCIVQPRGPRGFLTEFDKSNFLLFCILQGLGNLMRKQSTALTDAKWSKSIANVETRGVLLSREQDTLLFERICTFVALLADINVQSHAWLSEESKFTLMPEFYRVSMDYTCSTQSEASTYAKHLRTGQSIIQQASDLLRSIQRFEDLVRGLKFAHDTSYDMFLAHSLCLKIGTIRLFADFLWQNAPLSREDLQESWIQAYAHSALNHVENRLQHSGLEAVIYIEHLMLIGIEVRDLSNRHRVISLLKTIRGRGFVFAEVYIADLQLAWEAVPTCCAPVAQSSLLGCDLQEQGFV
ncbi:hypothetical protein F5883DRAFT_184646 [Diaporthe sp. PMI_573]|nr:hypothetical protein F5883DRAFT_184646 [Diaporthaceae sp. PMI_573]